MNLFNNFLTLAAKTTEVATGNENQMLWFVLGGGLLIIIIAVVIAVISTVASAVATVATEDDAENM